VNSGEPLTGQHRLVEIELVVLEENLSPKTYTTRWQNLAWLLFDEIIGVI